MTALDFFISNVLFPIIVMLTMVLAAVGWLAIGIGVMGFLLNWAP